jgi:hypothetical protein
MGWAFIKWNAGDMGASAVDLNVLYYSAKTHIWVYLDQHMCSRQQRIQHDLQVGCTDTDQELIAIYGMQSHLML